MTDKQQENSVTQEALPQGGSAIAVAETDSSPNSLQKEAEKKPEPVMSKGEKVFNWTTYTGLNYWVNLISSVIMADIAINGKGMWRKSLDVSINGTTKVLTKLGVSLRTAHNNARVGLESFSLLTGGTLLLLPLKLLEDNKRKIVHKINKKLDVNQIAPDGHEETPDEIYIEQEQPKQSVKNLIWRRIMGTTAVVSSGIAIDHLLKKKGRILPPETHELGWATVHYDAKVQGGKSRIEEKVFGWINKAAKAVRGKEFESHSKVSRWTKLAILDSMFTVITAVVMKVTSGAKKGKMPQEIDDSNDPPVIKDEIDNITTAADINDRIFAERIEKRVNKLVEAKNNDPIGLKKNFVEALQQKESPAIGVGV